jgi:pimeloyl-ACP methyl ester carboxylesterase
MPLAMRLAFELMAFLGRLGLRAPARNIAFPGLGRRLPSDNEHLDAPERALVERGVSRHEHPRQVLRCAVAAARKRDETPRLGEIAAPTLVVVGAEDPVRPLAEDMQRRIAGSTLAVIPGSPHGTAVTCPKAFNRVVLEFYDRVDGIGAVP